MKRLVWAMLASLALAQPASEPKAEYFQLFREVKVADTSKQAYVVLDAAVWMHARPDLSDIRLFDSAIQVPYALLTMGSSSFAESEKAEVLNLGLKGGRTEFLLDMGEGAQYDRVTLDLETRDFVGKATVDGVQSLSDANGTRLGTYPIFDFTEQHLGCNFTLHLPLSTFRFLRVNLYQQVKPTDVKGATWSNVQETKAKWNDMPASPHPPASGQSRQSVFEWDAPPNMPLDRVRVEVAAEQGNFSREASLTASNRTVAAQDIARVKIKRGDQTLVREELELSLPGIRSNHYRLVIENGDDLPLRITAIKAMSLQRRVYFDAKGKSSLRLYYGDEKLQAPNYEYPRLFDRETALREDAQFAAAVLGAEQNNPAYRGRPDDRPWSERHGWVLWLVLIVAVVGLAWMAMTGMKKS